MKSPRQIFAYGPLSLLLIMVAGVLDVETYLLRYEGDYERGDYLVTYVVPATNFTSYEAAIADCKNYGGELAVVNDREEMNDVADFLGYLKSRPRPVLRVYIAGSDEAREGKWVLPDNRPLPYSRWGKWGPVASLLNNCIVLDTEFKEMMAAGCVRHNEDRRFRYLCERKKLKN